MGINTKIEWADHTYNPWIGCSEVSPGCANCFAKAEWDNRRHRVVWGPGQPRSRTKTWGDPKKWNGQHEAFFAQHGRRQRVFCASLADVFDNEVPENWRIDLFSLIEETPNLDWLLLTKRIGNAAAMLPWSACSEPWHNVWIGATIVNQAEADRDIPKLLQVPATKRFLSMEPLLGPVNLWLPTRTWETGRGPFGTSAPALMCDHCCNGDRCDDTTHFERGRPDYAPHCRCPHCRGTGKGRPIDWVIVGGESGPGARPMHPEWAASLRKQCEAARVSFMFKQWGEWMPESAMTNAQRMHDLGQYECLFTKLDGSTHWIDKEDHTPFDASDVRMVKIGKKSAGRLLDGRTWDEVPA